MPKERSTTRKDRREIQKSNYLAGKARRPYIHTPSLATSFENSEDSSDEEVTTDDVCCRCLPVLSRYKDVFQGLTHHGTKLKKAKSINPDPKLPERAHYRDLVRQNDWIRENLFDGLGNFLFCAKCIRSAFKISQQRLCRQREMKRQFVQHPIVKMRKSEVEEQSLGEYVIMPDEVGDSFLKWWRSADSSTIVEVRVPHQRHGLAGKTSNSAKTSVLDDFLIFVDTNTQPNGRASDSSGPTSYFLPNFTTIQTPKKNVSNFPERCNRSVVFEFNRAQQESGKTGCSNGTAHNWLKKHRPKVAICPHKLDYCDTCAKKNELIHAKQTTINRLKQTGTSSSDVVQSLEQEVASIRASLEEHKEIATKSHKYHKEMVERCAKIWNEIKELEEREDLSQRELDHLTTRKHTFTLTFSCDYQMSKLVPYWGLSPQPGSTYYFQKLSHDILGIINHATDQGSVYLFDERVGPKNTDHTLSYFTHYLQESGNVPAWIKRIHLFMDNAGSTNKNCYTIAWALEMVQQKKFDFIRISFMIAGHTKFSVDQMFSRIAQSYNRSDIFNTAELASCIERYADIVIDKGEIVHTWRDSLIKYTKLPGIRSLHDFVIVRNPVSSKAVIHVRDYCHEGSIRDAPIGLAPGHVAEENAFPTESYIVKGSIRTLSTTKIAQINQMMENFIPQERRMTLS